MHHDNLSLPFLVLSLAAVFAPAAVAADDTMPAAGGRVAHYAHVAFRETPFADLRGIYPITPKFAKRYKHYRIVYDAGERPVEVSFRFDDELQDLNISRTALTFAPLTRIAYRDNEEIRTFFDRFGNPGTANGVYREVYEIDGDGNRIALSFYSVDGERIESDWGIYRYEWTVDRRGGVTERRVDEAGAPVSIRPGFPFYCLRLHYDQRGLLALMENFGKTCDELTLNELNAAQDKLEFNSKGGFRAWNVYDAEEKRSVGNGPMVARGVMERDALGHTTREYYEDAEGNIMTNAYGWTNTYASFDEFGNMVERFNHDADGNRIDNPQLGYSGYVMEYDETGKYRRALRYQDADGGPAVHRTRGYHAVASGYDGAGNRIRNRYEDADGRLVEHRGYCAAVIRYSFDDKHRLSSMRLFDESLQPAHHCVEGWHEQRYHYAPRGPVSRTEFFTSDGEAIAAGN